MDKRIVWILVIGVIVLLIAGGLVARERFGIFSSRSSGKIYADPQGRFTMEVDPAWQQMETGGAYTQFKLPEMPANMYLQVLEAGTVEDAFYQAMVNMGFDPGLLIGDSVTMYGDWFAYQQEDSAGLTYGLAGQVIGEQAFVMILKTDKPGVSVESASVLNTLTSIKITGAEKTALKSFADVEALVRQEVERLEGSSLSIAVVDREKILYTYVYGQANAAAGILADTETIYQFGSMTKVFTGTAVMQLVEQGLVDLDAWPGVYIPEFPQRWDVSVRQLLTHSACLPNSDRLTEGLIAYPEESFPTMEEIFTSYVKDYPDLLCEPGHASAYSNPPFLVLARIIEEVSGKPYVTYVAENLLTPLNMDSTSFPFVEPNERYAKDQYPAAKIDDFVARLNSYRGPGQEVFVLHKGESYATLNDYQILPPWGGLRGTPADVAHFMQMHLNGGRYGDQQFLKPESVAAMQQHQLAIDGSPLGFGLSWRVGEDGIGEYYYHVGSGAGSEGTLRIYPDLGLGVVVMSNIRGYQRDRIVEGLVNVWMATK